MKNLLTYCAADTYISSIQ